MSRGGLIKELTQDNKNLPVEVLVVVNLSLATPSAVLSCMPGSGTLVLSGLEGCLVTEGWLTDVALVVVLALFCAATN